MLSSLINKLKCKNDLSASEMQVAIHEILSTEDEGNIESFLKQLAEKGETAEEIYGVVTVMQSMMVKIKLPYKTLDIVGTGGDGFNTINISTGAALLAASCGVKISKHGNRSVSSLVGSADVLEAMGVNIGLTSQKIVKCIDSYNFGFMFAPRFHPALSQLKTVRKNIGMRTIFNLIGPLLNPTMPDFLMVGVAKKSYLDDFSKVLVKMGTKRALVFNGQGLDELSTAGRIDLIEINESTINSYSIAPEDYGFTKCLISDLQGYSAEFNADILKKMLAGECGPVADTVILNAGFANYLFGLCGSAKEGIALAKSVHKTGDALGLLQDIISETNNVKNHNEVGYA